MQQPPSATTAAPSAEAIVSIRTGQGMSRAHLAALAQIDRSQLWRIETGRAVPYIDTLGRLARALGVPVSALLDGAA